MFLLTKVQLGSVLLLVFTTDDQESPSHDRNDDSGWVGGVGVVERCHPGFLWLPKASAGEMPTP